MKEKNFVCPQRPRNLLANHVRSSWRHVTANDGKWRQMTANDGKWRLIPFNRARNGLKWKRKNLSVHRDQEIYWQSMDELLVKARLPEIFFYSVFLPNYVFLTKHIPFNRTRNGLKWKKKILSVHRDQEIYWRSMDELLVKARLPEIFFYSVFLPNYCQKSFFFIRCFYQTTCFWLSTFRSIALEMVSNGREKFCLTPETKKSIGESCTKLMTARDGKWRQMTANDGKWRQMTAHTVQSR